MKPSRRLNGRWGGLLPTPSKQELKELRISYRLSKAKAAEIMGVSDSTWYTWENPNHSANIPALYWHLFKHWAKNEHAPPPFAQVVSLSTPMRLARIKHELNALEDAYGYARRL